MTYFPNHISTNTTNYLNKYYIILNKMSKSINLVSPTNSISETFIAQMIPHHEAAINMSKNILKFTTDYNIENLCFNIINDQSHEILLMKNMKQRCARVKNYEHEITNYLKNFNKLLNIMIINMTNSSKSNNLNIDFLTEMIPHHEAAINMSQILLNNNICKELKVLCENSLSKQHTQLNQMQQWLNKLI